jgi:hypothetical protein
MPIKKIVMVRRKAGLTPEEFRDGYENSHSRLAVELFGHLWLSYKRHYLTTGHCFAEGGEDKGPDQVGFDAVSEFVFRDEHAYAEMTKIRPEDVARLKADEDKWFDLSRSFLMSCDMVEEDLGR